VGGGIVEPVTAVSYGREIAVHANSRRDRRSLLAIARRIDFLMIGAAVALSLIGAVMVYTATRSGVDGLSGHAFLERQAIWIVVGVVVMVVVAAIDYRQFRHFGYWIYGLVILSLVGVFALHEPSAYGAARWYPLGPLDLQPSEFAALGVVIAVATYCSNRQGVLTFKSTLGLLLIAGVPMLLVYKQPDLGTTIILGVSVAGMMLAADVRLRYLALLGVLVVGGAFFAIHLHILKSYQLDRLTCFLHPTKDITGCNWDLTQSRNAIASGGVHGTGLGRGLATNLALIPNQQNDFIFSAVGEQLGFVGSVVVIGLYGIIALRMLRAAQMAKDTFGRVVCVGALAFLSFSVFENIGMTIGLTPITGIPLPFVSYGGSALFAFYAAIGLVLSIELRRVLRR
jgi:rod shape determining protein RodA